MHNTRLTALFPGLMHNYTEIYVIWLTQLLTHDERYGFISLFICFPTFDSSFIFSQICGMTPSQDGSCSQRLSDGYYRLHESKLRNHVNCQICRLFCACCSIPWWQNVMVQGWVIAVRNWLCHIQIDVVLSSDNKVVLLAFVRSSLPSHHSRSSHLSVSISQSVLMVCLHRWTQYVELFKVHSKAGIRPVKNWVVGCWRGYLSGARCRLAYGPAGVTATHCLLL